MSIRKPLFKHDAQILNVKKVKRRKRLSFESLQSSLLHVGMLSWEMMKYLQISLQFKSNQWGIMLATNWQ